MQGKAAVTIESIAGCGKFQVIVTLCVYFLANSATAFTMIFMAFGNYNPGWRCNDNSNSSSNITINNMSFIDIQNYGQATESNTVGLAMMQSDSKNTSGNNSVFVVQILPKYLKEGNCSLFHSCKQIEFDPSSMTIVSEWGLLCDKKWIPSVIISIQMAGIFVGSFLSGHIGDAIGRKPTIYGSVLSIALLNVISLFSISWEMFAVLRFFIGITMALILNLYFVFTAEFVPEKWRSVMQGIPAWNVSSTFFALTCMYLKNWRHIIIVTASVGVIGFIPVFWVPESLRWLEVKNKSESFKRTAEKIARMNGETLPPLKTLQEMAKSRNQDGSVHSPEKIYNIFHLFRNGYAKYTILLFFPWLVISAVVYGLKHGIKALHGDFYTNLIIFNGIAVPFSVIHIFMPNLFGRKGAALIFSGLSAICLLGAGIMEFVVTSESDKSIGIPIVIFAAKVAIDGLWGVLDLLTMELYPTVIRGLGISWGNTMARVGGIISPYLIPNTKGDASITYTVMAAVMLISFVIYLILPETKGQPLKDTYGDIEIAEDDGNADRYDRNRSINKERNRIEPISMAVQQSLCKHNGSQIQRSHYGCASDLDE